MKATDALIVMARLVRIVNVMLLAVATRDVALAMNEIVTIALIVTVSDLANLLLPATVNPPPEPTPAKLTLVHRSILVSLIPGFINSQVTDHRALNSVI